MEKIVPLVVTISRQLGSGGAYIGQQLAKKLDIFYADREIISQAAKQLSVLEEDIELRDEKKASFWHSFVQSYACCTPEAYIPPQIIVPTDFKVFETEKEIIEKIAKEHSAIIIGRCGSFILSKRLNHISIFLYADSNFRKERIQKLYNLSEEQAAKLIAQSDKERAQYNFSFTKKEWADARQYDISINTGKIGLDGSVELIVNYLKTI